MPNLGLEVSPESTTKEVKQNFHGGGEGAKQAEERYKSNFKNLYAEKKFNKI